MNPVRSLARDKVASPKDLGGATSYGMNHTLKKLDTNQTELIVELIRDDLKMYIDRTESEIGKDLQLDGFRKGKVPKDLLKKNLDAKQVL